MAARPAPVNTVGDRAAAGRSAEPLLCLTPDLVPCGEADHGRGAENSVHAATALALLLVLGACRSAPPVVTQNDGAFVTVIQPRGDPQREAKDLADRTCGKHATLLSKLCLDAKCGREELKFWCK